MPPMSTDSQNPAPPSGPSHHPLPVVFDEEVAPAPAEAPVEPPFGRSYWRSLAEREGSASVESERGPEFPEGADLPPQGFMRREFLQLAGASLALAGLNACTEKPVERILPYTKNPRDLAPGVPLHYATAAQIAGAVTGLLVTAWEGRPTKVDGNPIHPVNRGATGVWEQAWLLQLYDGHRAREVREQKTTRAWRTFREQMKAKAASLEKTKGAGLRFLMEPGTSPLVRSLREQVQARFPEARFYSYAAVHDDAALEGARIAFGQPYTVHPDLAHADVVVSLDSDFVEPRGQGLLNARAFADRRDPNKSGKAGLNRLYAVGPRLSLTGMMADHRLRMRAAEVQGFALALLGQLSAEVSGLARFAPLATSHLVPAGWAKWMRVLVSDLLRSRERSLVLAGEGQPPLVHAIAHVINGALGAAGRTVHYRQPITHDVLSGPAGYQPLLDELKAGKVDTLVVTAHNPVYTAPADVPFKELFAGANFSVYLSPYEDETSPHLHWFIPAAHPLETWGDHRAPDGTVSIAQPLIQPLFNGMTEADVLSCFLPGDEKTVYVHLRELWSQRPEAGADFESTWERWLVDGFVPGTQMVPAETPEPRLDSVWQAAQPARNEPLRGLEIHFVHDYKVYDGRFTNVPWLQELPDPITKLTWDNAALLSPGTADRLKLRDGEVINLKYRGKQVMAPVLIAPGHADDSVTVSLGWGRESEAEQVALRRGFSAYALRHKVAPWFDDGLVIEKTGKRYPLSLTQEHWSMKMDWEDKDRPIALSQTVEEFQKHNEAGEYRGKLPNLYEHVKYEDYRWGMTIDLARCIGCNACAVACQAENNIPVVGKEQVARGREMLWLRIDRYFSGSLEDPAVITQPVMCVHCENAPCEYVCPVNATVHSDEGLNEMVYNRCIGTRYCSNNCPYKVRRFNYLHWQADRTNLEKMKMNPDVTVRARGVMEKCTYCVQRIERTRIQTRVENRPIRDGELRTACQQACPTEAIVFGTLSDKNARVTQLQADPRRYDLLHELGTRPRTGYLLRLKNPHPELA
nr:ion-translocating oxidoreductase complex subunit B [uncultured bacterium]